MIRKLVEFIQLRIVVSVVSVQRKARSRGSLLRNVSGRTALPAKTSG